MQYRGVYKEECSMKKVCASLFLIILLGRTLSSLDDLQLGMPIFDDNRDAQA